MRSGKGRRKLRLLIGLDIFLVLAIVLIFRSGRIQPVPEYEAMTDAARRFEAAAEAIRLERLARGLPLSEEDFLQVGLLGAESSAITTTLGELGAKRTAQTSDMAALCVRLLTEAGVEPGDRVGACMSGSFPGLDMAFLCACDAMEVEAVYTVSVGASAYGANLPDFTAPEMLLHLWETGLIRTPPDSVSAGGEEDSGANMIGYRLEEEDVIESTLARVSSLGLRYVCHPELEENVAYHTGLYGEIDCFVNVGGTVVGSGASHAVLGLGQGVLRDPKVRYEKNSGLLEYYLARGTPVIQLLNVKQLCMEYGISFDPPALPEIGASGVYYTKSYPKGAVLAAGIAALTLLIGFGAAERLRKIHSDGVPDVF